MRRLGAGAMLVPEASANGASAICYMRDGSVCKEHRDGRSICYLKYEWQLLWQVVVLAVVH